MTLSTGQLEHFRAQLLQLQAELYELDESSREDTRPVVLDQASVGRLSRMDAMQVQEMAQEMSRRRQQKLVAITGALRRLDTGDYGSCYVCGEDIDLRRLEFDPTSTRCIACAD